MKNREQCPPALHLESVFASGIILPRAVQVPHLSEVYQEETSKSILLHGACENEIQSTAVYRCRRSFQCASLLLFEGEIRYNTEEGCILI